MTLSTAAIAYYTIGTPILILLMFMISRSSKDQHIIHVPTYNEAMANAQRRLTASDCHTMNDVGIDGTAEDLERMLSSTKK